MFKVEKYFVATAIFILTTLLIIYSSSNGSSSLDYRGGFIYNVVSRAPLNLKKWVTKDGYLPVVGNKTMGLHCRQCALVTSSSHLLGSELGSQIDQTECTIRMNDAPTTGYEVDVGSKTTLRVVAHSSVYRVIRRPQEFLNKSQGAVCIFWGPPQKMQKNSRGGLYRLIHHVGLAFSNLSAFVIAPKRMQQFDDLFQRETGRDRKKSHSWLSTGWFTMVIAIELCDNVQVYGMAPPHHCRESQPKRMPYHYYEPKGPDECRTFIGNERAKKGNHHRFITEKDVFAEWAKLYNISFLQPSW
ncbi:alpha-N-acetylgalactosaminide alpha-2,6-sialyltransferase 6 [Stegostoma tigrinum]|uniref:alpha-N-acetylgalactosaminide alpha-2,6-sialyltransferase 6 n=1 Tax=Stegostoma tigrinum TaxID=3053191 RepID=UPI00202ADCD9|nr:alpha-N-acetylgalactosaminide alpha-2,6-sialyltransferase 6 [Stegostoma tigrinum]XP_059494258.1 alpha-N-acetylgalactosaminide alpha-2,6-sialyltransferase 6 [Stegostoma tigrinum]XP_059494259.1 alpha-N-acetylgalactosaminide alpha-2,6-sialyltransferase 6 [Stegostoma tigrinum]